MRRLVAPLILAGALALVPTASASQLQRRSEHTVSQFAGRTAARYLETYAGEGAPNWISSCSKGEPGIWECRVSTDGGECAVKLQILDEGPGSPPLYVTQLVARCAE
jgi:hypothetical protein